MIDYYGSRGLVETVDGERDMDTVFTLIQEKITAHGENSPKV